MVGGITSRSQITDFEYRFVLIYLRKGGMISVVYEIPNTATHKNVIWFQIRMYNVALFHERQCQKDLVCVGPYGSQIQSDVFAKALDNIPQVHAAVNNERIVSRGM
jgi:hypothetical protein